MLGTRLPLIGSSNTNPHAGRIKRMRQFIRLPTIVARGRMPDAFACGVCHHTTGPGGSENANITGLPFD